MKRGDPARLAVWLALTGLMITLSFAGRASGDEPQRDLFFHWSAVANWIASAAIVLVPALVIALHDRELLGLNRPRRLWRTTSYAVIAVLGVAVISNIVSAFGDPEKEQGIAPQHWVPGHNAAFVANVIGIAVLVPLSEETFFRGVGFGLLSRMWSVPVAIIVSGCLFGLAHGLVLGFLPLAFLGCMLALMRATSGSIVPGLVLHGMYNAAVVVLSVTGH